MNPETHSCDCGYTWCHGHDGTHLCGPQYRATIERQAQAIAALKAVQLTSGNKLVLPPMPEISGMHELEYVMQTPEDWDPDYRTIWQKLQVADCGKREWRKYAMQLRTLISTLAQTMDENAQPNTMSEDDAEQSARSKWTVKQWYEHVGAWENAQGELCFGSVMALGAMLKLMAKTRNFAAPVAQQDNKPFCYVRQSDIDSPIGSAIWAYRMAGGEWSVPVHIGTQDKSQ